jgi:hypothetical protein
MLCTHSVILCFVPYGSLVLTLSLASLQKTLIENMKTKHPIRFLPLNRVAVTPTFQLARFAGRKTGAPGRTWLMARMRVHCARLFIVLALAVAVESARAQGTAFTYQGELTYSGALANGVFDLQFTIYAAGSGGSALAGPLTRNAVTISNGVFTVLLDFGRAFSLARTGGWKLARAPMAARSRRSRRDNRSRRRRTRSPRPTWRAAEFPRALTPAP